MKFKVERIAESLTAAIASWDAVECVCLGEVSEEDVLDPYFAIVLDVYHRGPVPLPEERRRAFHEPGAFESSQIQPKDRFFIEGLPVRVEYKSTGSVEELLERGAEALWILKNSGTYIFYRLERGRALFQRSDWLESVRTRLRALPLALWEGLREVFQAKMEHFLADLGAAARRDDSFFYFVSLTGFLRYTAATLFAINRRFEPSHRSIEEHLRALKRLPDDFFGRWETLLRSKADFSREQRYKVAELIAKSVIACR